MRVHCPSCSEQFPLEAGFADDDGKRLAALFVELEPRFGRAVLAYLRLFSPAKRSLRMTRAIRLIEDLLDLVKVGSVTRDARTNERKPATVAMWAAGIEQMLAQRERLQLPLENHNYLRAVVWGIATDPQQAQQLANARSYRTAAAAPAPNHFDQLSQINGDLSLGLITKEEANRRLAALKGEA